MRMGFLERVPQFVLLLPWQPGCYGIIRCNIKDNLYFICLGHPHSRRSVEGKRLSNIV